MRDNFQQKKKFNVRHLFGERAALLEAGLVQMDAVPPAYAAVSTALLTLPAAGTSFVPLLGAAVLCLAAR